jgi:hypothetical protein
MYYSLAKVYTFYSARSKNPTHGDYAAVIWS